MGSAYGVLQLIGVILLLDSQTKSTSIKKYTLDVKKLEEDLESSGTTAIEMNLIKHGTNEEDPDVKKSIIKKKRKPKLPSKQFTFKQAMRTKKLWILVATFFLNGVSIVTTSSLYKSYGQTFISNDRYFTIVGSVASIFNSMGRPVWGKLLDLFSYRIIMSALAAITTIVTGSFLLCSIVHSAIGVQVMYFIWVCLLFFCIAGNFAIFPTTVAQTFGNTNMAPIYGIVFMGLAISSLMGALICSILLQIINYLGVFIMATIASVLSMGLSQFFSMKCVKKNKSLDNIPSAKEVSENGFV